MLRNEWTLTFQTENKIFKKQFVYLKIEALFKRKFLLISAKKYSNSLKEKWNDV